ncbi:hypothetical protein A1Q1_03365 [Trichosporon asahii var. asahii CBS 2479]|uniref:Uncharacterized protein n=1 Tax=Trichosporon asahii var. asahii (strain ATCC 90039 / CBS 2479 / JCM 2466 / KCTC 7840 / NBRC 103889/ NCYC 2677 / UAMH 7654) TaxID=1186058 RepID=J5RGV0_TRIAS|nr:hypothetical protein A1Q1_03365 [Trichosporon asahii var. asahii CBS 2479]EJT52563.1 hypothetical protein A1Q1_03365 [Trichosporon asahii var. asahii CBS 2479]
MPDTPDGASRPHRQAVPPPLPASQPPPPQQAPPGVRRGIGSSAAANPGGAPNANSGAASQANGTVPAGATAGMSATGIGSTATGVANGGGPSSSGAPASTNPANPGGGRPFGPNPNYTDYRNFIDMIHQDNVILRDVVSQAESQHLSEALAGFERAIIAARNSDVHATFAFRFPPCSQDLSVLHSSGVVIGIGRGDRGHQHGSAVDAAGWGSFGGGIGFEESHASGMGQFRGVSTSGNGQSVADDGASRDDDSDIDRSESCESSEGDEIEMNDAVEVNPERLAYRNLGGTASLVRPAVGRSAGIEPVPATPQPWSPAASLDQRPGPSTDVVPKQEHGTGRRPAFDFEDGMDVETPEARADRKGKRKAVEPPPVETPAQRRRPSPPVAPRGVAAPTAARYRTSLAPSPASAPAGSSSGTPARRDAPSTRTPARRDGPAVHTPAHRDAHTTRTPARRDRPVAHTPARSGAHTTPAPHGVPDPDHGNTIDRALRNAEALADETFDSDDATFAGRTMVWQGSPAGVLASSNATPMRISMSQTVPLPRAFHSVRQPPQSSPLARHRVVAASHVEHLTRRSTAPAESPGGNVSYAEGTSRMHPDYSAMYAEGIDEERMVKDSFVTSAPPAQRTTGMSVEEEEDEADKHGGGPSEEMEGIDASDSDDISDLHSSQADVYEESIDDEKHRGYDEELGDERKSLADDDDDQLTHRSQLLDKGAFGSDGVYDDPGELTSPSPEIKDRSPIFDPVPSPPDEFSDHFDDSDLPYPHYDWSMSTPRRVHTQLSDIREESIYSPAPLPRSTTVNSKSTAQPAEPAAPAAPTAPVASDVPLPQIGLPPRPLPVFIRPPQFLYPPQSSTTRTSASTFGTQRRSPSVELVPGPSRAVDPNETVISLSSNDTDRGPPPGPVRSSTEERENVADLLATGQLSPDSLRAKQAEEAAADAAVVAGRSSGPAPAEGEIDETHAHEVQPTLEPPVEESMPPESSTGKTPKPRRTGKSRSSSREPSADPDGFRPTRRSGRATKPVRYNE